MSTQREKTLAGAVNKLAAKIDTLEANLSDLPPETQINVLRSYPQLMKILVKRLGGKVEIRAKEMEQINNHVLNMGMNPTTRTMQLTLTRPKKKEKMN